MNRTGDAADRSTRCPHVGTDVGGLIVLNVTIFVAVDIHDALIDVLALPPIRRGLIEMPWTLITVFFTAEALAHIAVAVLVIGLMGVRLERVARSRHVLGVFWPRDLLVRSPSSRPPPRRGSTSLPSQLRLRSSVW